MNKEVDYEDFKSKIKIIIFALIACAIIFGIIYLFPSLEFLIFFIGMGLLLIAGLSLQVAYDLLKIISLKLQNQTLTYYQLGVIVIVPIILSQYFLLEVGQSITITFNTIFNSWYQLLPVGVIFIFSYAAANENNDKYYFKGYVWASFIIFVITLFGYYAVDFGGGTDDYDYESGYTTEYLTEVLPQLIFEGHYFIQYWKYLLTSYLALTIKKLEF